MTTKEVVIYLAAEPSINTAGVISFIATKIIPILFAVIAVIVISRAFKGAQTKANTDIIINLLIGVFIFVGAGLFMAFGKQLVDLVGG
jgi:uncharacterized paraquat-inducible protein A